MTWLFVARADHSISPVRVAAAMGFLIVGFVVWESVDPKLVRLLVPERPWLYALASAITVLVMLAIYFALLGTTRDAVPTLVGVPLGQFFGFRRRAERREAAPAGVLDKDDGRRWRTGSP